MPLTPFHMGPGVAIKAVAGPYFSLMVFGFSQVAMDIEPLVRIIRGDAVLHGLTHTYVGATLIGLASAVVGRPICQLFLNHWTPDPHSPFMNWLRGSKLISWPAAIAGALVARTVTSFSTASCIPTCNLLHLYRRSTVYCMSSRSEVYISFACFAVLLVLF
jgi:hypothetical protein